MQHDQQVQVWLERLRAEVAMELGLDVRTGELGSVSSRTLGRYGAVLWNQAKQLAALAAEDPPGSTEGAGNRPATVPKVRRTPKNQHKPHPDSL